MSNYHQFTPILLGIVLISTPVLSQEDDQRPPRDRRHGHHQDLKQLDQNGDGQLSIDEFVDGHMKQLKERFNRIDKNGDGVLSHDEMKDARKRHRDRAERRRSDRGPRGDDFQE